MKLKQILNRILLPSIGAIVVISPVTATIAYAHLKTQTYESKNDDSQANSKDLQVQPSSKEQQISELEKQLKGMEDKLKDVIGKTSEHFVEERVNFSQLVSAYKYLQSQLIEVGGNKIKIREIDKKKLVFDGKDIVERTQDILNAITVFRQDATSALEKEIARLSKLVTEEERKKTAAQNDKNTSDAKRQAAEKAHQAAEEALEAAEKAKTKSELDNLIKIDSLKAALLVKSSLFTEYKTKKTTYLSRTFFEIKNYDPKKSFTAEDLGFDLDPQFKNLGRCALKFKLLDQKDQTTTEFKVTPVIANDTNDQIISFEEKTINITGFLSTNNINQLPTVYLDQNKTLQSISGSAPAKVTAVFQIGFNAKKTAYQMPITIETVSNYLPPQITSLQYMFQNAKAFNQDLGSWDVSKVENMRSMFSNATAFNNNGQSLASWANKLNKVKNMDNMFNGSKNCALDLSSWIVSIEEIPTDFNKGSQIDNPKLPKAWQQVEPVSG